MRASTYALREAVEEVAAVLTAQTGKENSSDHEGMFAGLSQCISV